MLQIPNVLILFCYPNYCQVNTVTNNSMYTFHYRGMCSSSNEHHYYTVIGNNFLNFKKDILKEIPLLGKVELQGLVPMVYKLKS